MPVSRDLAADLARDIVTLYSELAERLARAIALDLARGIDSPDWAHTKLANARRLRRRFQRLLDRMDGPMRERIGQILVLAYYRGSVEALRETYALQQSPFEKALRKTRIAALARLRAASRRREQALWRELDQIKQDLPGVEAIQRLAFTLTSRLRGTHTPILRWADDTYRDVVARTSLVDVLAGTRTRLRAAQATFEQFLTRGVTGFTDVSGRRWELASYVEMAVRTGTMQATVEAHADRLRDSGINLVVINDTPQECHLCRPWEGKILTIGPASQVVDALTGQPIHVNIAGTLTEAVAAGLYHPNCRHRQIAYIPGVTKIPRDTADPAGDEARQRQRAIERAIRKWKLRAAGGLTPEAAEFAQAKVGQWRDAMAEHLDAHPELRRLRHREQIGTAR